MAKSGSIEIIVRDRVEPTRSTVDTRASLADHGRHCGGFSDAYAGRITRIVVAALTKPIAHAVSGRRPFFRGGSLFLWTGVFGMVNPFAPAAILDDERGVFGDGSIRRRAAFVYREIEFTEPFSGFLVYDGWWFRQRVSINGIGVWWRISWTSFHKRIDFRMPAEVDAKESPARIDICFGRGLGIRRFQVTIGGIIAYDEIA